MRHSDQGLNGTVRKCFIVAGRSVNDRLVRSPASCSAAYSKKQTRERSSFNKPSQVTVLIIISSDEGWREDVYVYVK
jgi:hypothetical protein